MTVKETRQMQNAAYKEMEKNKLSETAVAAFRHKPYKLDWRKEEKNGKER